MEALEKTGLLDGLDAGNRAERAELIAWLLEQGFSVEQIRHESAPISLPARRALGDDGSYVSAREVSEDHGVDLELLQRIERALGLPRVDDPDAAVLHRADAEAAARQQQLVEIGLDADRVVLMVRRLAEGLSRAVPAVRYAVLSAVLRPGITELQVATTYEAVLRQVAPLLGPLVCDVMFVQLRSGSGGRASSMRANGLLAPRFPVLASLLSRSLTWSGSLVWARLYRQRTWCDWLNVWPIWRVKSWSRRSGWLKRLVTR